MANMAKSVVVSCPQLCPDGTIEITALVSEI